jgi:hypothetical protein
VSNIAALALDPASWGVDRVVHVVDDPHRHLVTQVERRLLNLEPAWRSWCEANAMIRRAAEFVASYRIVRRRTFTSSNDNKLLPPQAHACFRLFNVA